MKLPISALAIVALLFAAAPAGAAPLSFTLSSAASGTTWTIENEGVVDDLVGSDGDTYAIRLTLSLAGTGAATTYLSAFAVDFSGSNFDALSLESGPSGFGWVLTPHTALAGNSGGCGGSSAGALCLGDGSIADSNVSLGTAASYEWLFHVDLGSSGFADVTTLAFALTTIQGNGFKGGATVITGTAGSLFLAQAGPTPDPQGEPGTVPGGDVPVPEPGSLILLGSGLLFAANRMRRR